MAETKSLYAQGALQPPVLMVRPVAQIEEAVKDVTDKGTVVLSYEHEEQEIEVAPEQFSCIQLNTDRT